MSEGKFDKEQLLTSRQFTGVDKDYLNILLEEDKKYTVKQCLKMLENEKKRSVK